MTAKVVLWLPGLLLYFLIYETESLNFWSLQPLILLWSLGATQNESLFFGAAQHFRILASSLGLSSAVLSFQVLGFKFPSLPG